MRALLGILLLLCIAVMLSKDRRAIRPRTVIGAFGIQAFVAWLVLYNEAGRNALNGLAEFVNAVIGFGSQGIGFLFGPLLDVQAIGFVFAFQVLPVIIFFSSLISLLYYVGVMQWVVRIMGGVLAWALGTSQAESLSATANIFVGQTEAPLVVKPFIKGMTESELFAIMVGGLASVAGSVLAGYAGLGIELKYLLAASFMAAPGGLLMAKLMVPETETPKTKGSLTGQDVGAVFGIGAVVLGFHTILSGLLLPPYEGLVILADLAVAALGYVGVRRAGLLPDEDDAMHDTDDEEGPVNVFDAAALGASSGLHLALNVGAMLLAFIGLISLINGGLATLGGMLGYPTLSLELVLGYVFQPLAYCLGIAAEESHIAGSFIGKKIVVNEFVAFVDLTNTVNTVGLSAHTQAVVAFALCGFANLSSIAILLGGLGVLAPSRRADIARLGIRAVVAGSLANLMSAALASFFLSLG
jgi:CNT family concentrative nucleoside transporter